MGFPLKLSYLPLQILVKCKITGNYLRGLLLKKPKHFCHTGLPEGTVISFRVHLYVIFKSHVESNEFKMIRILLLLPVKLT